MAIRYAATSTAAGSTGTCSGASTRTRTAVPSARQLSWSARCRNAPTRPSSSRAGGRRSSTTRRTSASASRASRRRAASSCWARSGSWTWLAAASAAKAIPVNVGPRPSCSSRRSRRRSSSLASTIRSRDRCSSAETTTACRATASGAATVARIRRSASAETSLAGPEPDGQGADDLPAVAEVLRRRLGRPDPDRRDRSPVRLDGDVRQLQRVPDRGGHPERPRAAVLSSAPSRDDELGRIRAVAVHRPVDQPLQPRQQRGRDQDQQHGGQGRTTELGGDEDGPGRRPPRRRRPAPRGTATAR